MISRFLLLPLACAIVSSLSLGCSEDDDEIVYQGPVTPSTFTPPPVPTPPETSEESETPPGCNEASGPVALDVPALPTSPCVTTLGLPSSGAPFVATSQSLLVPSLDEALLLPTNNLRCPISDEGTAVGSEVGVVRAASLGEKLWLIGSENSGAFTAEGALIATCAGAKGQQITADASDKARAFFVDGSSSLGVLSLSEGEDGATCATARVSLDDGKGLALAIAPASTGAKLWAASIRNDGCAATTRIARYDTDGKRDKSLNPLDAWALGACTADALIELDGRLVIADATCKQLIVFDLTKGAVTGATKLPGSRIPKALAAGNTANTRLLALTQLAAGSGFELIAAPLPPR